MLENGLIRKLSLKFMTSQTRKQIHVFYNQDFYKQGQGEIDEKSRKC